jgi:hypothetical protein
VAYQEISLLEFQNQFDSDKKCLMEKIRSDGWKSYGKAVKDKDIEHHRVVLINPKIPVSIYLILFQSGKELAHFFAESNSRFLKCSAYGHLKLNVVM